METPLAQTPNSNHDAKNALLVLARLLGKQAAKDFAEAEQADPVTPLNQDEGAIDD